jgi:hypothetical protein
MISDVNYVAGEALRWARQDPVEHWINAGPGDKTPIEETVREYLDQHNPFPDDIRVEVLRLDETGWDQATILERTGLDEWVVGYDDGQQACSDHHALRPARPATRD